MNPNIREIGNVVKNMQVVGASMRGPNINAPQFNQAAADIVKQGIQQKVNSQTKFNMPHIGSDNKQS